MEIPLLFALPPLRKQNPFVLLVKLACRAQTFRAVFDIGKCSLIAQDKQSNLGQQR
jgi:hypothetical protein